jgi:hypothetical protein
MLIPKNYGKNTKDRIIVYAICSIIFLGFLILGFIVTSEVSIGVGAIGIALCIILTIKAVYNEKSGKGNSELEVG